MKISKENIVLKWLLKGDVSIQYQTYRDLLNIEKPVLRAKIANEGWGAKFLSLQNEEGHWGKDFYQPKWISTHYTLLDLKNLCISPNVKTIKKSISVVLENYKGKDGGINPSKTLDTSDVCVNGMFLNYASYFNAEEVELKSIIDFLLNEHMKDGGFNCHSNRIGATHSSLHTTLSVIEGITEYYKNGYKYKIKELLNAELQSREFLLRHRLFKSHRTGKIISNQMTRLSYPPRWYFDILRALDYFCLSKVKYDARMQDAIDIILRKRGKDNRWKLQANHNGQIHFNMELVGKPSMWNTLRALRVFKYYELIIK